MDLVLTMDTDSTYNIVNLHSQATHYVRSYFSLDLSERKKRNDNFLTIEIRIGKQKETFKIDKKKGNYLKFFRDSHSENNKITLYQDFSPIKIKLKRKKTEGEGFD